MDLTSTFAPIEKTVDQDDGTLLVYGKATDGGLDLDDQRCDPTWLSTAMPDWFRSAGNIRAQHRADSAVGKATEHTYDADGHYITARIVDREAIAKTKAGVFTGFSIGIRRPKIVKSDRAPNGLINGGTITEVSLCDRPANPACTLMLCKAAKAGWEGRQSDFDAERGLVKCEDLNFYPENNVRVKTVAEPIENDDAPFVPAEERAPANPVFVEPVEKAKACCDNCAGPGDKCACGCSQCPMAVNKAIEEITEKTVADALARLTEAIGKQRGDDKVEPTFDRDAAIELVKATNGLGQNESGDIDGAGAAIAQIAQLIISEAKDLAKMPAQGCDIHLLMSAVDALRCFSRREQMEQAGTDPDNVLMLSADVDLEKAKYDADELKAMLKAGKAMKNPNGDPSYPIGDKEDLSNAIHAVGRGSGDHDDIRSYIKRRASALGASDLIPESWNKMAEATTTKADNVSDSVTDSAAEDVAVVEKAADEATEVIDEQPEDLTKAVGAAIDQDSLVKAFKDALGEDDSPIRKMFVDIVEASTKSAAEALSAELGARLEKVEQMATPGGPALRRTEVERVNARKSDLVVQAARFKALATASEDQDLRKGYMQKALQLESELKAL